MTPDVNPDNKQRRAILFAVFLALSLGCAAYRLLVWHRMEQTAALFLGLPVILAATLIFGVKTPRSLFGSVMMAVTLFLLLSMILLGEGFVCVLMAAPVIYLIAAFVTALIDVARKRFGRKTGVFALLPFVAMSLEGVAPELSFPRENTVVVESSVARNAEVVERNLAAPIPLAGKLPLFLRLGFPAPVEAAGKGLSVGSVRRVHFAGGEGQPGDLTCVVEERGANWVRFRFTSDTSHIAHWLKWESATGEWRAAGAGESRVRWTVHYRRLLDPAWYFGPLERLGVTLAAKYLLWDVAAQ